MNSHYSVKIEEFAQRHFIKNFEKKYKGHWEVTLDSIIAELERIDFLLQTDRAETVLDLDEIKIIKTKFRIFKSKESAKTSGNRCIVSIQKKKQTVTVLLVYCKTDISGHNETTQWQKLIKENYPEYKTLFRN